MCYSATILIAVAARGCLCATTPTILCIADDLANEYSLPSTERRTNQNVIIGMRAARRHLCSKVRRALPLNRTKQDISTFLDTMEQLCQTAEMGPSDEEFV